MNDFSSFKKQKLLVENWRTYNGTNQEQLDEVQLPGASFIVSFIRSLGDISVILAKAAETLNQPKLKEFADKATAFHENFVKFEKEHPTLLKLMMFGDVVGSVKGKGLEYVMKQIADSIKGEQPKKEEEEPAPVSESIYDNAVLEDGTLVCAGCLEELLESQRTIIQEAKYQGRSVTLNKPMKGDVKKFKVYVKDPKTGNVKKVNFGDPNMRIKKSNPARRKSFRARHNCDNPGPKTKARYWSCRKW